MVREVVSQLSALREAGMCCGAAHSVEDRGSAVAVGSVGSCSIHCSLQTAHSSGTSSGHLPNHRRSAYTLRPNSLPCLFLHSSRKFAKKCNYFKFSLSRNFLCSFLSVGLFSFVIFYSFFSSVFNKVCGFGSWRNCCFLVDTCH